MRRAEREEHARRVRAWLESTPPDRRDHVIAGIVLLGLAAAPLLPLTLVVLAVLVGRLRRRRRIGWVLRVVLGGLAGGHVAFWSARWVLLRRLDRVLADFEAGRPGVGGS